MNDRPTQPLLSRLARRVLSLAALALATAFTPTASMATTVSMGTSHGCSVADTSLPTCWGSLPVQDQGTSTVKDIRVGLDFSCALLSSGVRCWGNNDLGQLGTTTVEPKGQWVEGIYNPNQITLGARHACVVNWGSLVCWGDASQGQLGEPVRSAVARPMPIPGMPKAVQAAAGKSATCAVQDDGRVLCVGTGSGLAGAADAPATPRGVPGISDAMEVALFDGHACVLRKEGKVSCWGGNRFGELGVAANNGAQTTPIEVTNLGAAAKAVTVGNGFSCALLVNGTVKCWGNNANGQLGTALGGAATGLVTGITDATAISAGQTAACAALQGGYVQCWGEGAGWSSETCRVLGGVYPQHSTSWGPVAEITVCRPQGSAAPMAVKGLGPAKDAAQVLDWAEKTLPGTFPTQGPPALDLGNGSPYYLRAYAGGHTLAVNAHGTPHLLYMGPLGNGQLLDLGPLSRWLSEAIQEEGDASGMQLQVAPYMAYIGMNGACDGFLVPYAIRGGLNGLPENLVTTSVRVEYAGQSMAFPIRDRFHMVALTTETDWISQRTRRPGEPIPSGMREEPVLHGITQGCPSFNPVDQEVEVTVFYTLGQHKGQLRARAKVGAVA
ncbi:Regulator of chromosome condensation (RCC1) repeat containing protein [Acidovorax sp. CF316]|uniref:RCC1 domain-containing protein n=1 Tax=Acidovorax sp. CF316 TaxID=1144317 RepID=UPI00026BCB4D|nr:hypothetical protein [Acidovorax sp. CF316]EJE52231.1 Regulator of chromosome condensation (RCC1) repeat containing protein [Acidovorax sp. CF316]